MFELYAVKIALRAHRGSYLPGANVINMSSIKVLFVLIIGIISSLHSCENEMDDLRDPFIGSYSCKVIYKNTLDPSHAMYSPDTIYYTTLDVSKHESSSMLEISYDGCMSEVEFNISDSTFKAISQRLYGRFFSDSIYMHHYLTPAAFLSWIYRGKKIN